MILSAVVSPQLVERTILTLRPSLMRCAMSASFLACFSGQLFSIASKSTSSSLKAMPFLWSALNKHFAFESSTGWVSPFAGVRLLESAFMQSLKIGFGIGFSSLFWLVVFRTYNLPEQRGILNKQVQECAA